MRLLFALGIMVALLFTSATAATAQSGGPVFGLTPYNELIGFDRSNPGEIDSRVAIDGEQMVGVDFRPATGELWGVGVSGAVYTIDPASGAVTVQGQITEALQGNIISVDFNPVPDAIRVVSDTGQNLRLANLDEEIETNVDGNLAYAEGDANAGVQPNVVANAYANNLDGVEDTVLYNIDSALGITTIQEPPNDGVQNTVGALGVPTTNNAGYDITSLSGVDEAFVALQPAEGQGSVFYSQDLASGAVAEIGAIGYGEVVTDIAIPTAQMGVDDDAPAMDDGAMGELPDTGGVTPATLALFSGAAMGLMGLATIAVIRQRSES